jgi:hypothetical protein
MACIVRGSQRGEADCAVISANVTRAIMSGIEMAKQVPKISEAEWAVWNPY